MEIGQALQAAVAPGLTRLEAQLLLLHVLGRDQRAWLLAHDRDPLTHAQAQAFADLCQRRRNSEPLAYITGRKAFFGLDLAVDARVLDPRADTETLVDWALELLAGLAMPLVLDLGTGSGAVALALAHACPDAQVHATDASQDALAVAHANARRLALPVRFGLGNWFTNDLPACTYDLVVSNPPYIAVDDPHLAALAHEPLQALASGADGLDDIRQIIAQAPLHLRPGAWLLLEHGFDQAPTVRALLAARGFGAAQSRCDLAGHARCSGGLWTGQPATVK